MCGNTTFVTVQQRLACPLSRSHRSISSPQQQLISSPAGIFVHRLSGFVICTYRCRRLSLFFVFGSACAARRGCDSRSVDGGLPSPPPPSLSLTSLVSQCAARALRSLSSPVPKSVARSVVRRVSFLPLCGCGAGGRGIGAFPDCCRTRVPPFVTCAHCTARAAAQCGWPEGSLSTASLLTLLVCRGSDRVRARLVWRCTAVPLACTLTHIRVSSHPLPPSSLIHSKRLRTSALNIAPLFFFLWPGDTFYWDLCQKTCERDPKKKAKKRQHYKDEQRGTSEGVGDEVPLT